MIRKLTAALLGAAACVCANSGAAQGRDHPVDVQPGDGGVLTLVVENDLFGGTDRHYTNGVRLEWVAGPDGRQQMREIAGSEFELKADLVFLAMGFVGPCKAGAVDQSGVDLDPRGNVLADTNDYRTSQPSIFACGDARRGQSLVVWAIREGRQCARAVDAHLMGASTLPR